MDPNMFKTCFISFLFFLLQCRHFATNQDQKDQAIQLVTVQEKTDLELDVSETKEIKDKDLFTLVHMKKWQQAKEKALLELESSPYDKQALKVLAVSYYGEGDFDKSLFCLQLLEEKYPKDILVLNLKGVIKYKQSKSVHQYKNALAILQEVYQLDPSIVASGLNLAYVNLNLGRLRESSLIFDQILKDQPDNLPALLGKLHVQQRLRDDKEIYGTMTRLRRHYSDHPVVQYQIALFERGVNHNLAQSQKYLEKIFSNKNHMELLMLEKSKDLWSRNEMDLKGRQKNTKY